MLFDLYYGLQTAGNAMVMRPLSSIAVSPLEEYGRNGPLFAALDLYTKSSMAEFYPGLSIEQFLNLPREMREFMLVISEARKIERFQDEQVSLRNAGLGKNGLSIQLPKPK